MTTEEQQYSIDLVPFMNPAPYSVPDVRRNSAYSQSYNLSYRTSLLNFQ